MHVKKVVLVRNHCTSHLLSLSSRDFWGWLLLWVSRLFQFICSLQELNIDREPGSCLWGETVPKFDFDFSCFTRVWGKMLVLILAGCLVIGSGLYPFSQVCWFLWVWFWRLCLGHQVLVVGESSHRLISFHSRDQRIPVDILWNQIWKGLLMIVWLWKWRHLGLHILFREPRVIVKGWWGH